MDFTLSNKINHKLSKVDHLRLQFSQVFQKHPTLCKTIIASLLGVSLVASKWDKSETQPNNRYNVPVDTFIPRGYVLIPMNIENYENLDSILGSQGIVNIYSKSEEQVEPTQIATSVRVLRAPNAPEKLSILSPEASAHHFLNPNLKYWVVVQGKTLLGTKIVNREKQKKGRTITFTEGG